MFAVLVACGGSPPPVSRVRVEMRSLGAEPRRALHYDLGVTAAQRYRLETQTTLTIVIGTSETTTVFPTLRTTLEVALDARTPDGARARLVETVRDVRVLEDGDTSPGPRAQLARELARVVGLQLAREVSRDGEDRDEADRVPPGPVARPTLAEQRSEIARGHARFPAGAIGVGARWDREIESALAGATLTEVSHDQLLELDDAHARIESDISISAPEQLIDRDVTLRRVEGTGHAVQTWPSDALYPTEDATASLVFTVDMHRQTATMRIGVVTSSRRLP